MKHKQQNRKLITIVTCTHCNNTPVIVKYMEKNLDNL